MNEREAIGKRLRDERKRLGLTQDQLGITPQVQRRYEAGTSTPGADYLADFSTRGGDVLYVLTGQRTAGVLAPDEAALVENYRAAPPAKQHMIQEVSSALAQYRSTARTGSDKDGND